MLPIPTAKVFRSRKGALWWSFWVIVAAVTTVGFADSPAGNATAAAASAPVNALGQPVSDADLKTLMGVINAS